MSILLILASWVAGGCGGRTGLEAESEERAGSGGHDAAADGPSEGPVDDVAVVSPTDSGCFFLQPSPLGSLDTCSYVLPSASSGASCATAGFKPGNCPEMSLTGCCIVTEGTAYAVEAICFYGVPEYIPEEACENSSLPTGNARWQTTLP